MNLLHNLRHIKGYLFIRRTVKLDKCNNGLKTFNLCNVRSSNFESRSLYSTNFGYNCNISSLTQGNNGKTNQLVINRSLHCSTYQRFQYASHLQKDSTQSHTHDFKSDPEVKSWMNEMNNDFDPTNKSTAEISDYDSGNSSDIESGSSNSSSDSEGEENIDKMKSEEIEEIDYEEFFHEEEAIRHEDLIEQQPIPIDLTRGIKGVFDVDEIVKVLEEENGENIVVIPVPPDINYTDNLVIVTGMSQRHLLGMAELVRWIYKRKRSDKDPPTVRIEGLQSRDWLAIDLGNLVLHLMMEKVRKKYDLESLWLLGPENDPQLQETEHNPYILNQDKMDNYSNPVSLNKSEYSEVYGKEKSPQFYGMQSVTGWHEETQDYGRPKGSEMESDNVKGSKPEHDNQKGSKSS